MQDMYPGKVNSPQTELASAIDDIQTTIPLLDASVLPDPPNICTIGAGEDAETILYTGINGNDLTGVTRGFQGQARGWSAGVKVARYFTAYDYEAMVQNIRSHASRHAAAGEDPITPEALGAVKRSFPRIHNADLNVLKYAGNYCIGSNPTPLPGGADSYGILFAADNPSDRFFQLYMDVGGGKLFFRQGVGIETAWGAWQEVLTKQVLPVESGTWTPTLAGATTPGAPTYVVRDGFYYRIGKLVFVHFWLTISNKGGLTGSLHVSGLPFSVSPSVPGASMQSLSISQYTGVVHPNDTGSLHAVFQSGATNIFFVFSFRNGSPVISVDDSHIGNSFQFRGSGVYQTA
jgi:hypothetical protein